MKKGNKKSIEKSKIKKCKRKCIYAKRRKNICMYNLNTI